jgi:hypothetical protein
MFGPYLAAIHRIIIQTRGIASLCHLKTPHVLEALVSLLALPSGEAGAAYQLARGWASSLGNNMASPDKVNVNNVMCCRLQEDPNIRAAFLPYMDRLVTLIKVTQKFLKQAAHCLPKPRGCYYEENVNQVMLERNENAPEP